MHKEEKLYMDLQKPNALNLPGQNEKYLESLKKILEQKKTRNNNESR